MPKTKKDSENQLRQTLKDKMSEIGISVHALEKQAGLKRSAVQNILHGRSKNPSAHILSAVAKILDCDIDELLNNPETSQYTHKSSADSRGKPLDMKLYAQAAAVAADVFEKTSVELSMNQALAYIKEIYQYAIDSNLNTVDQNFAAWLVGKHIKK